MTEPSDPDPGDVPDTPPPPPPTTPPDDPSAPPPPTTPTAPAPTQPAPTGPTLPATPTPSPGTRGTPTRGGRPTPGATRSDPMSTWRGWWVVNDRSLLPDRADDGRTTTPSPTADAVRAGLRQRRRAAVTREILPALRQVLDPAAGVNDLLRRTGLLALGKVAETEGDAALLVAWLTDARADLPVREAAALGVGLLRRTEPDRRFEPHVLDAIRARLLRVTDDASEPDALRATCAISLGLLGDQPFGDGIHRDGRLVTAQLWRGLASSAAGLDLPVARLTALGMQPAAGVPDGVRESLRGIAFGRRTLDRSWDDLERGHALTALVRLGGPDALTTPQKILPAQRTSTALRRAGFLALGRTAASLTERERVQAAEVIRQAFQRAKDPQTQGLAWIAAGRLVSAHVTAGDPLVRDLETLWEQLLAEARSGSTSTRGYAALAVGLAARMESEDAVGSQPLRRVRKQAEGLLLAGLSKARGEADLRGAYAIALGIMRASSAVPPLVAVVEDRSAVDALRSDAAVALGQIQHAGPEVVRALHVALSERKRPRVQSGAALALSLLQGPTAGTRLLRELEQAVTSTDVLRITEPLGYLGDPALARPLVEYALDASNAAYPRASMLVALGNLGDPEPRPSLALLGRDANYPAAPPTLRDVLTTR